MAKAGRPSKFSDALATKICSLIMTGCSLREVCRREGMPTRSTVHLWLATKDSFSDQYARACQIRQDELFDEMFDIADDGTNDWTTRQQGDSDVEVVNQEAIQRSRLRIDTRKWALSKMNPKKYGDKMDLNHGGSVEVNAVSDEKLDARIAELAAQLGISPAEAKAKD